MNDLALVLLTVLAAAALAALVTAVDRRWPTDTPSGTVSGAAPGPTTDDPAGERR